MKEHRKRQSWKDFTLPESSKAESTLPVSGRRISPKTPAGVSGEIVDDLHYPSIERLFDGYPESFLEARRGLIQTRERLERVVRQGSQHEAARASRVVTAYDHTLAILDELERRSKEDPPEDSSR